MFQSAAVFQNGINDLFAGNLFFDDIGSESAAAFSGVYFEADLVASIAEIPS